MKVVIVEDEKLSAKRLQNIINQDHPQLELTATLYSVEDAREWLKTEPSPDLLFLDIELHDGTGFDVLQLFSDPPPVIFTTAYDRYALKAFKFYSVDYLLKPVEPSELKQALSKFHKIQDMVWKEQIKGLSQAYSNSYKQRFLIRIGERYHNVPVEEVGYFYYCNSATYLYNHQGKSYQVDQSLDQLELVLNPLEFYRVNRQFIISMGAIDSIHSYLNSRLLLKLNPQTQEDVIVSRDRVVGFKKWMDH